VSDLLLDALDRLVPATHGEQGDWQAVLAGAGIDRPAMAASRPSRARRLTRRQLVVALTVVFAVAVVSATPAFGLRDLIRDLVGGRTSVVFQESRPAPPAIKQQFLRMALGAPAGMNPHVLPNQARQITFRGGGGRKRVIWVAPTRAGGFCSVGGVSGGCISRSTERQAGAVTINGGLLIKAGTDAASVVQVSGYVFSAKVTSLTLEFADRRTAELPFVFVSSPISAGFYTYGIPSDQQHRGHWPTKIVARDKHGTVLGTDALRLPTIGLVPTRPLTSPRPQPPRALPAAATVHPKAPSQTATADGVTVVAGANGAVQLTVHNLPARLQQLLHRTVSISCFRLTREFGLFTVLGDGTSGAFADSIGFNIRNVGRPLDGCELDSADGHRWPDKLASHSPLELAFTAKGRAYFADRAAARDLALFVRSRRMQQIRKEPDKQLLHDMQATYGPALAKSRIRYTLTPDGITFSEASTTGRIFRVVIENRRIKHSNVEPYAKIF
jgi:hypothetical protein